MSDAGWNPDPTGRHQLRYWDGAAWTDHVSDGGVTATDPLQAQAQPQPQAQAQPQVQAHAQPVGTQPIQPPAAPASLGAAATPSSGRSKTPLLIGGVVAVVAVAAAAFFVLGGDDGGRDLETARTGLENILDDNDAPADFEEDAIDIGPCLFDFAGKIDDPIRNADRDVTDVDPDTNLVVVFFPPDEPALTCGVFVDDSDDGFFLDIYIASMGEGKDAQDLVDQYNALSDDTDIDIELAELGKAEGGTMLRACADQFLFPGQRADDFIADPYCDTVWVADGMVVGIEQFGAQSIGADDAKAMVLLMLDDVFAALEAEA